MADSVIVQSRLRDAIKELDLRMDGDLPDAMHEKVISLLNDAAERAKGNDRKTLRPYDL